MRWGFLVWVLVMLLVLMGVLYLRTRMVVVVGNILEKVWQLTTSLECNDWRRRNIIA